MAEHLKQVSKQVESRQATDQGAREESLIDEAVDESILERVEMLAARAEASDNIEADGIGEKLNELAATTEEELDALRINLVQEAERASRRNGSDQVLDDVREERTARFTESDPMQRDLGVVSVEPGRDDTSSVLGLHQSNSSIAASDGVIEGNLDEPKDQTITEPKVDEGTPA